MPLMIAPNTPGLPEATSDTEEVVSGKHTCLQPGLSPVTWALLLQGAAPFLSGSHGFVLADKPCAWLRLFFSEIPQP